MPHYDVLQTKIRLRPSIRRYQMLVLGLSLLCICLCGVVLVVSCALYFSGGVEKLTSNAPAWPGPHIACIDCNKLQGNPYDLSQPDPLLDKLTEVLKDGVKMCCADSSEQMSALLEATMRRQEVNKEPLSSFDASDFTFSPVSAHKRLYPPEFIKDLQKPLFMNDSLVTCHFKAKDDYLVEHARGVEVLEDESGLRVTKTGLYFIYSSIQFRPDSVYRCKDFKYQTWGHYVLKISPNHPSRTGCLLKTSHTCCDECAMDDETSFTGGAFYMSAGDILRVEVAAHGLIYFRKDSSFLGLMMLGLENEAPVSQPSDTK